MKLEFGSFLATDNVKLPGLLYQPDKPTDKVAVWLHGLASSIFYTPTWMNAIGTALTDQGIAFWAFNNRGAYESKQLRVVNPNDPTDNQRIQAGANFELIADCVHDIDGAVKYLQSKGFKEFYLLGHSSGANKICAYDNLAKDNPFSKYVMAGPGDDVGIPFAESGSKKFWKTIDYAAAAVSDEKPLKILPKTTVLPGFSAQSAWDLLNPDGQYNTFPFYEATHERIGSKELFKEYKAITRPTLVILGEEDEYAFTAGGSQAALNLLMANTSNQMLKVNDFMLVPFADHSFHEAEETFAQKVADWLA
ncbi:MAG TPA: alpha/beta hydrolase [Candidatus Saccharimonadales bacterium]|nr:alpha/beta hydrolase [Candidatus Saccharimonadales bacterium]